MNSSVPDLYKPFRPRMTWLFARVTVALLVGGAALLIILAPGTGGGYAPTDIGAIVAVTAAAALLTWRHGTVAGYPTPEGLRVRNLVYTTVLAWPEIESVRFGQGRPWVSLNLANGHTVAVMAIQGADGARATEDAHRLAALVEIHSAPKNK